MLSFPPSVFCMLLHSGHVSPFVLNGLSVSEYFETFPDTPSVTVRTTGIVTAVDSNGFYVQDAMGDDDIATSDAIFCFTGDSPALAVGDEITLTGPVSEFFPGGTSSRNLPTTQIFRPTFEILSSGNDLPAPVLLGEGGRIPPSQRIDGNDAFDTYDAENDGIDFFESLEAMRVTVQYAWAVAGTNSFGEIFTVVDQGASASGISSRGTLNLSPDDFNPEKIQIDEDSGVFNFDFPNVDVGAILGDVTGVVGYSFGNFEVYPTEDFVDGIIPSSIVPTSTLLSGSDEKLLVASYNVLNLDPNDEDGDEDVANSPSVSSAAVTPSSSEPELSWTS